MKTTTFQTTINLQLENSFGVIDKQDDVIIEINMSVKDDYGSFELYDIDTGGDKWYAEGGIWIQDNVITDYDGVFELLPPIIQQLKDWGYDTSEIE